MLVEVCVALRLVSLLVVGLVNVREKLPFAIDNHQKSGPQTDAERYALGEIWWYEIRDDVRDIDRKLMQCAANSALSKSTGRKLGCFIQIQKFRATRMGFIISKSVLGFIVESAASIHASVTGDHPIRALLQIAVTIVALGMAVAKLVENRGKLMSYFHDWLSKSYAFQLFSYLFSYGDDATKTEADTAVFMSEAMRHAYGLVTSDGQEPMTDLDGAMSESDARFGATASGDDTTLNGGEPTNDESRGGSPMRLSPRLSPRLASSSPRGSSPRRNLPSFDASAGSPLMSDQYSAGTDYPAISQLRMMRGDPQDSMLMSEIGTGSFVAKRRSVTFKDHDEPQAARRQRDLSAATAAAAAAAASPKLIVGSGSSEPSPSTAGGTRRTVPTRILRSSSVGGRRT